MDGGAAGANLHNNAIYTKQASGLGQDRSADGSIQRHCTHVDDPGPIKRRYL
jgi:hypothetical protein